MSSRLNSKLRRVSRLNDVVSSLSPKQSTPSEAGGTTKDESFKEVPATTNPGEQQKASKMVAEMKLIDNGTEDSFTQLQNFPHTNFPRNTPCFIVGPKGSGKTWLLAALLQKQTKAGELDRVFYLYANNVDTTITRALGNYDYLYQIPKKHALGFIIKYLSKKTKYTSAYRFLHYTQRTDIHKDLPPDATIRDLKHAHWYWDNNLEEWSYIKHLKTFGDVHTYCRKVYNKYAKATIIRVGTLTINCGPLKPGQFDMIVMDDVAQFTDLLSGTRTNSPLYQYFTITRQNLTSFYMTGQETKQLPLMYREQLGACVLMHGTEDWSSLRISRGMQKQISQTMITLSDHEGVLYNFNDNQLEVIRS